MSGAAIVKIVGEPWLSRAKAYREEYEAYTKAWWDFAKSVGATGVSGSFAGHRPCMFFENGPSPEGWTRRDRRGRSTPKRGADALAPYLQLPAMPSTRHIFGDRITEVLSYRGPNCHGSGMVGRFADGPNIGWYGETYIARIPHAGRAAAEHLKAYPDHTIERDADKWELPEGVEEISEAELDLISAQHRVQQERAAA